MSAAPQLTARQQEIWNFLVEYVDRHGYPPTVREIGEAVGLASPSTVHAHLANLERAGPAAARPDEAARARADRARAARGARRRARRAELAKLPLARPDRGRRPAARRGEHRGRARRARAARPQRDFLLRVKGESMIDAGILDGDIVVVAARPGRAERRDRGRARRRRRVGRRGDGEDVLPRGTAASACSPRTRARADLRRPRPDPRQGRRGSSGALMSRPSPRFNRTLDQELAALAARRVSSSASSAASSCCTRGRRVRLPRVRQPALRRPEIARQIRARIRLAGRVTAVALLRRRVEESPDTAGQDAGGKARRRKPTESGTERRPPPSAFSGDAGGKGETVG